MATPRVTNRYPRRGERVAPKTLREFLVEPVPEHLQQEGDDANLNLCDLDETAWERFPSKTLSELSRIIVDRVTTHHTRKLFRRRHFPRPPKTVRLDDLRLENRTRRCLAREGFEDDLSPLGDYTIGKVLSIRAFGPRCLLDLLSALESPRFRIGQEQGAGSERLALCEELTAAARELAKLPAAKLIRSNDPRFGSFMQAADVEAQTASELAKRLHKRSHDPPDPPYVAEQVRQLVLRIKGMPKLTLEEELIEIFGSTPYERNRKILIGYYGWEDGQQHTLTEIGGQFGITRERIRQVCAKLTKRYKDVETIVAPVMNRALALIHKRLPCAAVTLEKEFVKRGLTAIGMRLEGVATGAKLLGRRLSLRIVKVDPYKPGSPPPPGNRLAVRPEQVAATSAIVDLAKKEVYFHGLSMVKDIERMSSEKSPGRVGQELVVQTLMLIKGFSWLQQKSGWFQLLPIAKHGLPKAIDKILAVAGEVTVSQMRKAMARNRRLWREPPPEDVLLEYCRQMPGAHVDGERIISDPPRDWQASLTGVEAQLVRVLKKHGPVMERGAMEDLCVASGMNRFSFHAFVSWSPTITQFGHSVYGLLGAKTSKREIDRLIALRRANRLSHRVLDALRVRLHTRVLTEEVLLLGRGEPGVAVGRADHAELVGIDAEPFLELQAELKRGPGVLVLQHVVLLGHAERLPLSQVS